METYIILDCTEYSECLLDIIKAFKKIGWNVYNSQGKIEYLPVDDMGNYDWKFESISEDMLFNIILQKIDKCEIIGVNLFNNTGNEGFSFLATDTSNIMLDICIYRRILGNGQTDIKWYEENIIHKLTYSGVNITSYIIEEYDN